MYEYVIKRWGEKLDNLIEKYKNGTDKLSTSLKKKNLRSFGVKFTHNTNKIEGSTLSKGDTKIILEDKQTPINSNLFDVIETKAHMQVYENMISKSSGLTIEKILKWHKTIFNLTKTFHAGQIRNGPVFIAGSNYVPPPSRLDINMLLKELMIWYNKVLSKYHPVFVAAIFHHRFVSIHPFEDGNGRMTRLIMNNILFLNLCPMYDLDTKYLKAYYNALERANLKENEMYFISWFFPRYISYVKKTMMSLGF